MPAHARPLGFAFVAASLALATLPPTAGCRAATQIKVDVHTNLRCDEVHGTALRVGRPGDNFAPKVPVGISTACEGGRIGDFVLVPGDDKDDELAFELVTAVTAAQPEQCTPPAYEGCIVARRALRYEPHSTLYVDVPMRADCINVACSENSTCYQANECRSSRIDDPERCETRGVCGPDALGGATGAAGGAGAGGAGGEGGGGAGGMGGAGGASGAAGSGGGVAGDPRVLSAGFHHSCAADTTGGLSCWGQLGYQDKPFDESWRPFGRDFGRKPTVVGGTSGVGLATSGSTHACFGLGLGPTYGLSCFGSNQEGQLGNPTTSQDPGGPPSPVPNEDWSTASAGNLHTCAIRGGNLFCWGFNLDLQASQPDVDEQPLPSQVGGEDDWQTISAGYSHTCGVRGGHLHCWGGNFTGQLGTGEVSPPRAYDRDNEVDVAGGWVSVASGVGHTCALSSAGAIHCWGANNSGQSGEGTDPAPPHNLQVEGPWLELSAGRRHTCAIKQGGLIYCWGQNTFGQLGRDTGGAPSDAVPAPISDVGPWTQLEAGADHTCARRQLGGEVYCWGRNDFGQCGQQNTAPVKTPARVVF